MRLTRYTDYALRTLIYVGLHEPRQSSIAEIARAYGISESHLTKVVHQLGRLGLIRTIRAGAAVCGWPGRRARSWSARSCARRRTILPWSECFSVALARSRRHAVCDAY